MNDTCCVKGCSGRVVCVVQDVVKRRDLSTGRYIIEPDGDPKGFCSEHVRKFHKRRGRPIGEAVTEEDDHLPF